MNIKILKNFKKLMPQEEIFIQSMLDVEIQLEEDRQATKRLINLVEMTKNLVSRHICMERLN